MTGGRISFSEMHVVSGTTTLFLPMLSLLLGEKILGNPSYYGKHLKQKFEKKLIDYAADPAVYLQDCETKVLGSNPAVNCSTFHGRVTYKSSYRKQKTLRASEAIDFLVQLFKPPIFY